MKRINIVLFMMAALLLVATSCQKDIESLVDLTAQIENINGGSKVYMEGLYPVWNTGDAVKVNGETYSVTVSGTGTERVAKINGVTVSAPYYAVYPADIVTGDAAETTTITLPAEQEFAVSDGHQTVKLPMAAYAASGSSLTFHNLCSLVKVTVSNTTGEAFTLDKIRLISQSANLSGSGSVNITASNPLTLTSGGKEVTLKGINTSIANSGSKDFYIVIPTYTTACSLSVEVIAKGGIAMKTKAAVTIERNKVYPMTFTVASSTFAKGSGITALDGTFTVAAGKTVKFAKGNVWYNNGWTTHTNQYDKSSGAANNFDGFTFGYGSSYSATWGTTSYSQNFIDWGYLFSSSTATWRTLSAAEWEYLLFSRSGYCYVKAQVNGVKGLIIFPDGYSGTISGDGIGTVNSNTAAFPTTNMTTSTWSTMQSNGCVFLPGNNYWASTPGGNSDRAYRLWCGVDTINVVEQASGGTRASNYSVRLVKDNN